MIDIDFYAWAVQIIGQVPAHSEYLYDIFVMLLVIGVVFVFLITPLAIIYRVGGR